MASSNSVKPKLLSRDDILKADDIKTELVEVPEWGGAVMVRGLTGAERDALEEEVTSQRGSSVRVNLRNLRAKLVVRSVVDEQGKHLFTPADVDALGKKSAAALQRVFNVASRLSGLSREDLEELTKNSEDGQSEDSTSV